MRVEYESVKIMVKFANFKKLACKCSAASRQGGRVMRNASGKILRGRTMGTMPWGAWFGASESSPAPDVAIYGVPKKYAFLKTVCNWFAGTIQSPAPASVVTITLSFPPLSSPFTLLFFFLGGGANFAVPRNLPLCAMEHVAHT